ncbi:hypothetical protein [Variovorax atrisoli]|uniref:hypothetical protein n=1 Tax=Variovorax atrisoli TaxID=3394203 RepID=UPI003396E39E
MTIKHCSRCGERKPCFAFGKNAKRPDGLQDHCKACRAAHYAANAERIKAAVAAYREANPEKIVEMQAAYRAGHKDRIRAQQREYFRKAYATFHAQFVGPRRPARRPKGAGPLLSPGAIKPPKSTQKLQPPPARALTPEEVAEAQRLIAKFEAARKAAPAASAIPSVSSRKSTFQRLADAEQARADGVEVMEEAQIPAELRDRRAAALATAKTVAARVSTPVRVARVAYVPQAQA